MLRPAGQDPTVALRRLPVSAHSMLSGPGYPARGCLLSFPQSLELADEGLSRERCSVGPRVLTLDRLMGGGDEHGSSQPSTWPAGLHGLTD